MSEALDQLQLFPDGGELNIPALRSLSAEDWAEWIRVRLHGQDTRLPYDRDEYPYSPARLFVELARDRAELVKKDLPAFVDGALAVLNAADVAAEPPEVLDGILELVAHLHRADAAARAKLADLINRRFFLANRRLPLLHEGALYALACAQRAAKGADREVFLPWLQPQMQEEPDWRHRFMVPAFAGIAFASPAMPGRELRQLLRTVVAAEEQAGKFVVILAPAILALYVDRETPQLRDELFDAVANGKNGAALWERLRQAIGHARSLPTYEEMAALRVMVGRPVRSRAAGGARVWDRQTAGCPA